MAITKTTIIEYVLVLEQSPDPVLEVRYIDTLDDTEDADLPVRSKRMVRLERYDADSNATDYSGYEQLVIDIADAVWTNDPENGGE